MAVDLAELPTVAFAERSALPDEAAVYFVLGEDDVVFYVGQSLSLAQRWTQHHRTRQLKMMGAMRIAWLTVNGRTNRLDVERACIKHFTPLLNQATVADPTCLNLRVSGSFYTRLERLAVRETERRGVDVTVSWVARWLMDRSIAEAENE